MNDTDNVAPQPQAAAARRRFGRGKTLLFLGIAAVAAAFAGGFATSAFSNEGHGWGMMHMGMGHGDMSDPAKMGEHIERMVGHLAVEIDATPEQESKLAEIAKAAAADLVPLREQWREARADAIGLLTAPTVDRAAIEQFRTAHLALADTASRRLAEALADAAEVLTPEQREALAERMAQMRGHGHGRD